MYYPYFRGRQSELLAVKDLVTSGLLSPNIIPVIEPVKISSTIKRTLEAFALKDDSRKIAIILNPEKGISSQSNNSNLKWCDVLELEGRANIIPGFLLNERAESLVADFINRPGCVNKSTIAFATRDSINFIMSDQGLRLLSSLKPAVVAYPGEVQFADRVKGILKEAEYSAESVLFRDAFHKRRVNADYAQETDEWFSNDHLYYTKNGYSGFGDYSIVGDTYDEGGFAPYAVAIHIVYFDHDNQLCIHHFVSDTNDDFRDTAGKFGEAGKKLERWCNERPDVFRTKGLETLLAYSKDNAFPGLPTVKKLCIMHHLELMGQFLDKHEEQK